MQRKWSLREEIVSASQRWPVILAFILIGALLGALAAWLVPAPYQAIEDIYVGLDVYRAMRDMNIPVRVEGANDYKNWQMEDLKLVITSQPVINETIKLLRKEDGYWNNINKKSLAGMLQVYWRSAGKWRLVATHPNPQYARQAIETWKSVALSEVYSAVALSQEVMVLDAIIQANAAQIAELTARQADLNQAMVELQNISDRIDPIKAQSSGTAENQATSASEDIRQEILAIIQAFDLLPPDSTLWSSFPPEASVSSSENSNNQDSSSQSEQDFLDYQGWLDLLINYLEIQVKGIQAQIDQLNSDLVELRNRYAEAGAASWGLSANLVVESQDEFSPEIIKIRPAGQMILMGALLGFLVWLLFELALITLRSKKVEPKPQKRLSNISAKSTDEIP